MQDLKNVDNLVKSRAMAGDFPLAPSQTPYLDRQKPLPRENPKYSKFKWWQVAILFPFLLVEVTRVLFLLVLLHLLIHELGHVIGGLLVGDQFNRIRVGPVEIDSSWKVSWHWGWHAIMSGGVTTLPRTRKGIRWKIFFSTLAGPFANFAAVFLLILWMMHKQSLMGGAGQIFVAVGAIMGVINLAPQQDHGQMTDGMRMWVLLFDRAKRERLISVLIWLADMKQGKKADSIKGYSIEKWSSINDGNSLQVVTNWAAYAQAQDAESAGRYLENCLAQCSTTTPDFRNALILEAANCQVAWRKQVDMAQAWLADHKPKDNSVGHLWVETLILQSLQQFDQALEKVDSALFFIDERANIPALARQKPKFEKLRKSLCEQALENNSAKTVS